MDTDTVLHQYIIPNAGPIATVIAAVLAASVAFLFGLAQYSIAKRQAKTAAIAAETARNKLRMDLFDKRLPFYKVVVSAWNAAASTGVFDSNDRRKYVEGIAGSEWLFDEDVTGYISAQFWQMLVVLDNANIEYANALATGSENLKEGRKQQRDIVLSTIVEQRPVIDALFKPYLQLKH